MKVAISDFKARMSQYLRDVKEGEKLELLERGVPIAEVTAIHSKQDDEDFIIPAQKPFKDFTSLKPAVTFTEFDVVDFLMEDRNKR